MKEEENPRYWNNYPVEEEMKYNTPFKELFKALKKENKRLKKKLKKLKREHFGLEIFDKSIRGEHKKNVLCIDSFGNIFTAYYCEKKEAWFLKNHTPVSQNFKWCKIPKGLRY